MAEIDADRQPESRYGHDRQRPSDDDDRRRRLRLSADSGPQRRRQEPERRDEIGHHRRAQPAIRSEDDGFREGMSSFPDLADVEAQDDAVHHRDTRRLK
jgi:hypothetical protein